MLLEDLKRLEAETWLKEEDEIGDFAKRNMEFLVGLRKLTPELIALWEAVKETEQIEPLPRRIESALRALEAAD